MIRAAYGLSLLLAACSAGPPPAPQPANLQALQSVHDWQHEPGEGLNAAWDSGVRAILGRLSRPQVIEAINAAGFDCIYGEGHENYPDPMAVCTRSFATRACQMDWEISSTANKGMVDSVDGSFRRDCVGTADDWPDKVKSAIDDQLAPPKPPH
jgi:hypothetical protein